MKRRTHQHVKNPASFASIPLDPCIEEEEEEYDDDALGTTPSTTKTTTTTPRTRRSSGCRRSSDVMVFTLPTLQRRNKRAPVNDDRCVLLYVSRRLAQRFVCSLTLVSMATLCLKIQEMQLRGESVMTLLWLHLGVYIMTMTKLSPFDPHHDNNNNNHSPTTSLVNVTTAMFREKDQEPIRITTSTSIPATYLTENPSEKNTLLEPSLPPLFVGNAAELHQQLQQQQHHVNLRLHLNHLKNKQQLQPPENPLKNAGAGDQKQQQPQFLYRKRLSRSEFLHLVETQSLHQVLMEHAKQNQGQWEPVVQQQEQEQEFASPQPKQQQQQQRKRHEPPQQVPLHMKPIPVATEEVVRLVESFKQREARRKKQQQQEQEESIESSSKSSSHTKMQAVPVSTTPMVPVPPPPLKEEKEWNVPTVTPTTQQNDDEERYGQLRPSASWTQSSVTAKRSSSSSSLDGWETTTTTSMVEPTLLLSSSSSSSWGPEFAWIERAHNVVTTDLSLLYHDQEEDDMSSWNHQQPQRLVAAQPLFLHMKQ